MLKLQTTTSLSRGTFSLYHGCLQFNIHTATETLTTPPPPPATNTDAHRTLSSTPHNPTMDLSSTHHHQNPNSSIAVIKPSPEDEYLSNSTHLSRQQVLRRRSHHLKQLAKCYREHYWGLMEEVRVRYREYLWKFGTSPFLEDRNDEEKDIVKQEQIRDGIDEGIDSGNGIGFPCVVNGCKLKAMTLTKFCHVHILSDPKQQLYKPCEFFLKSAHAGHVPCGKPVLRSIVPSLCSMHFLKAQQHVVRALRKGGLNVTSTNKFAPKFHVIVTEYVREIQEKRKNGSKGNKKKIVPKLETES